MAERFHHGLCILMADDSEEDAFFVRRALEATGLEHCFQHVQDGAQAIAYLRGVAPYDDRKRFPFPNLFLCDIKMPGVDGYGVLRWLNLHPQCKVIPTVMFSSSALEEDVKRCYEAGANAFLTKPHSLDDLTTAINHLYYFWRDCEVPPAPPGERCCADAVADAGVPNSPAEFK